MMLEKFKSIKLPVKICLSFQAVFNAFGTLFILLSSVGLLCCLNEIERLRRTTDDAIDQIQIITDGGARGKIKKHITNINKRSAYPIDFKSDLERFDPFRADPKDMEEYCWTLIYNRCGGSLPGAPGIGPPGPPGPPGDRGLPGRPGPVGHMGPPGMNGHKGQKGEKGRVGHTGEIGSDGPRGPPGVSGIDGLRGPDGRRGKRGSPGRPGKQGNDGLRGLPGQKGQKGDKGDKGGAVFGPGGNCSCKGMKGDKGQRGLVGFDGYKGEKGEPGKKGDSGYGMTGYKGIKGERGDKGDKGDPGFCTGKCSPRNTEQTSTSTPTPISTKPSSTIRKLFTSPTATTTATSTSATTTKTTTTVYPQTPSGPTTRSTVPPSLPPRTTDCKIKRIGKPTLLRQDKPAFGTVMLDPMQPNKIWLSRGYHGQLLEEYDSMDNFKKNHYDKMYNLRYRRYYGTHHAIYNNVFYFQFAGQNNIVGYDLEFQDITTSVDIPNSHHNDSKYLYKDSRAYYGVSADENGVWVIYGIFRNGSSKINVMKLDKALTIERVWKLPVKIGRYGNGFIACGILYLMKDAKSLRTKIDYAYDLYKDVELDVNISLFNPFRRNAMISFYKNMANSKRSILFGWDGGNVLKYPLLM